ncbi:MAG: hypothetical protein PHT12_05225 [Patescibacteria group bacterium]|nr:hypothetical protein [Patescibacteria group bacterium]
MAKRCATLQNDPAQHKIRDQVVVTVVDPTADGGTIRVSGEIVSVSYRVDDPNHPRRHAVVYGVKLNNRLGPCLVQAGTYAADQVAAAVS